MPSVACIELRLQFTCFAWESRVVCLARRMPSVARCLHAVCCLVCTFRVALCLPVAFWFEYVGCRLMHASGSCCMLSFSHAACLLHVVRFASCTLSVAVLSFVDAACCLMHPPVCASHVACCRPKYHAATCFLHGACCSSVCCILPVLDVASSSWQRVCVACCMLHVASRLLRMANFCCILSFLHAYVRCMSSALRVARCLLHAVCFAGRRMHVFMLHVPCCNFAGCLFCLLHVARCMLHRVCVACCRLHVASCLLCSLHVCG